MAENYSEEEQSRFESYCSIHLKKDQQNLPLDKQIKALRKRDKTKWFHLLINVGALLAFGYSFYYDITQLSHTFFYIICVIFAVNVILIFYQKKQINETIEYIEWKRERDST